MDWCGEHKQYSGKSEPKGICSRCWSLYFYRHPEAKEVLQREYREAEDLLTDAS